MPGLWGGQCLEDGPGPVALHRLPATDFVNLTSALGSEILIFLASKRFVFSGGFPKGHNSDEYI